MKRTNTQKELPGVETLKKKKKKLLRSTLQQPSGIPPSPLLFLLTNFQNLTNLCLVNFYILKKSLKLFIGSFYFVLSLIYIWR